MIDKASGREGEISPDAVRSPPRRDVEGILLLDKPLGLSSNQALQRVKRLYRARKAGHTGSLDPLATGMLPVCFGQATKVSAYLLDSEKSYRFRVAFGIQTSTGDLEGSTVSTGESVVSEQRLREAVESLRGPMMQVPPMYSALKHQGRRLYELARAGVTVDREPRPVHVRSLEIARYDPSEPVFVLRCSKGTYVRTLAEELARRAGTVAHLTELRRLAVEPFDATGMVSMEAVEHAAACGETALNSLLAPMDTAVGYLPRMELTPPEALRLRHGQPVQLAIGESPAGPVRLYDERGLFLGMGEVLPDRGIVPLRLLAESASRGQQDFGL